MGRESVCSPGDIINQIDQRMAFLASVLSPKAHNEELTLNYESSEGLYLVFQDIRGQLAALDAQITSASEGGK